MNIKSENKTKGKYGEDKACEYLVKQGWKILNRNYRYSRFSEIDIIAKDGNTLVFVEVKARSTMNYGHPFESVNKQKMKNIYMAALAYLKITKEKYTKYRIDIISILGKENPKIEHLKDVSLN